MSDLLALPFRRRRLPLVDGAVSAVAGVADGLLEPLDHVVVGLVEGDRPAGKGKEGCERETRICGRRQSDAKWKVITMTVRIDGKLPSAMVRIGVTNGTADDGWLEGME